MKNYVLFDTFDTNMSKSFKVEKEGKVMISIDDNIGLLYLYISNDENRGFSKLVKDDVELNTAENNYFVFIDLMPDTFVRVGADSGSFGSTRGHIALT